MAVITRRTFLASTAALAVGSGVRVQGSGIRDQGLPPITWHPANPVLRPTEPWEGSFAAPYSGGIFRVDGEWRCYYLAGDDHDILAVAFSDDGIAWSRKMRLRTLDNADSTGIVRCPDGSWAMSAYQGRMIGLFASPDGLDWTTKAYQFRVGDRTTFWHDGTAFCWGVRAGGGTAGDPRRAEYVSSPTLIPAEWNPKPWLKADADDPCMADCGGAAQLYAVDVVKYQSVYLGLATIWRGLQDGRPKLNDVTLMVSADGKDFARPWREPWLGRSDTPGAWNYGNVQSVGNGLHVVGDTVYLYASGRAGVVGSSGNGVVSMGLGTVSKAALDAALGL